MACFVLMSDNLLQFLVRKFELMLLFYVIIVNSAGISFIMLGLVPSNFLLTFQSFFSMMKSLKGFFLSLILYQIKIGLIFCNLNDSIQSCFSSYTTDKIDWKFYELTLWKYKIILKFWSCFESGWLFSLGFSEFLDNSLRSICIRHFWCILVDKSLPFFQNWCSYVNIRRSLNRIWL